MTGKTIINHVTNKFSRNCRNEWNVSHLPYIWTIIIFVGIIVETEAITYKIPLSYAHEISHSSFMASISHHSSVKIDNSLVESNIMGKSGQGYYFTVNIGNPPQTLNVLVDTGSSNFAVAAAPDPLIDKYFHTNLSNTFRYKGKKVSIPYTQGNWEGDLGTDTVVLAIAPELHVRTDIACIVKSNKVFINGSNWQGILGLAYEAIIQPDTSVRPFFDTLVKEKFVSDVFSFQLCRHNDHSKNYSSGGIMTIGGIDPKLYIGEITYTPLWREWYYEVIMTSLSIGDIPVPVDCKELNSDKTIVDSGTTNLRLPQVVFNKVVDLFQRALSGINDGNENGTIPEDFWAGESVMCWSEDNAPWRRFPNIRISLVHSWNSTFTLVITPQQYLQEVHSKPNHDSGHRRCHKFAINPSNTGTVLGAIIMEGFYMVFDRQNKRVGFAKSTCSVWNSCCPQPQIIGPLPAKDPMRCAYEIPESGSEHALVIIAYMMAGVCALCTIPLFLMLVQWMWSRIHHRCNSNRSDTASLVGEE